MCPLEEATTVMKVLGYLRAMEYASVIWSYIKLESVKNRFTKRHIGLRNMIYVDGINFVEKNKAVVRLTINAFCKFSRELFIYEQFRIEVWW